MPCQLNLINHKAPSTHKHSARHASGSPANRWLRCCSIQGQLPLKHPATDSEQPQADQAFSKQRNIPIRGLRPVWYLVGCAAIMAYGWRKVFIGNREKKYVVLAIPPIFSSPGRITTRSHPLPATIPRPDPPQSPPAPLSLTTPFGPPKHPSHPIFMELMRHTNPRFLSSELGREKMWSRIYIIPLLQAEEDRDQARRYFADQAREKELFGSTSSPYNSDRYGPPESLLPVGHVFGRGNCAMVLCGKMKNE